jgi:hypothetical protein
MTSRRTLPRDPAVRPAIQPMCAHAPELAPDLLYTRADAGCCTSPAYKRKNPRNSAARVSHAIKQHDAENILAATHFAMQCDLPLNRFVTIHWQQARLEGPVQEATLRFLKLARDWMRLRGAQLAFVWVRENGPAKGEHVHILLHCPPALARGFGERQRGWLKQAGAHFCRGVIFTRPIGRSYRHASVGLQFGEAYTDHLGEVLGYVLKGASAQAARVLGLVRLEPSGMIVGKRCSTSENIGRKARGRVSGQPTCARIYKHPNFPTL